MTLDPLSRNVLRELCMNSRITVSELAKKVGCTRVTALSRMRKVEKEMGLKYAIEFDENKLGLAYNYIIAIKLSRAVNKEKLAKLLQTSRVPQFAAICEGDFNILIHAAAGNHVEYLKWTFAMRYALRETLISWNASHYALNRLGSFQLQNRTFEELDLAPFQMSILKELNLNSRMSINEIGRKLGVPGIRVRYALDSFIKKGVITRFTTFVQKPPQGVNLIILMHYNYGPKFIGSLDKIRKLVWEETDCDVNASIFNIELNGPFDSIEWAFCPDINAAYERVRRREKIYGDSVRNETALITDLVLGYWPLRNMDLSIAYKKDRTMWKGNRL